MSKNVIGHWVIASKTLEKNNERMKRDIFVNKYPILKEGERINNILQSGIRIYDDKWIRDWLKQSLF